MEKQSLIQEKSNKEVIIKNIKDNLNYIYIVLMIIANCLISLLKIEDGYVGLRYPNDLLGWIMWITQILIQTFIGVMILNSFRRQGIKIGHKKIKNIYEEYLITISEPNKDTKPRSLKYYLRTKNTKDSLTKSLIYVIISVFVGSVAISANLNSLLSLVINIIFAVSFGIKAMTEAEEYVLTELIVWYKIQINKINERKTICKDTIKKEQCSD